MELKRFTGLCKKRSHERGCKCKKMLHAHT